MSYICYIYERREHVPYMEVLSANTPGEAAERARRLLRDRPLSNLAEIWEGDQLIRSFERSELEREGLNP